MDHVLTNVKNQWTYVEKTVWVPANIDKLNLRVGLQYDSVGQSVWFDDVKIEVVGANENEILDEKNYYPFGMEHQGYNGNLIGNENNYQTYQNKEMEKGLGLDWHDFGARRFQSDIARWTSLDPLAEKFYSWSPYTGMNDNPVMFVDPTGMESEGVEVELETSDVDVMVNIGYGRKMASSQFGGAMSFSGGTPVLNSSGEGKLQNAFNAEIDNAFGDGADRLVPVEERTKAGVRDVISKVPTLNDIYCGFNEFIPIDTHPDFLSKKGSDAETYSYDDSNLPHLKPAIMFYQASFTSYRWLSGVILHEFGHVGSFLNGCYYESYQRLIPIFGEREAKKQAKYREEIYAYKYALKIGGINPENFSGYRKARRRIKEKP